MRPRFRGSGFLASAILVFALIALLIPSGGGSVPIDHGATAWTMANEDDSGGAIMVCSVPVGSAAANWANDNYDGINGAGDVASLCTWEEPRDARVALVPPRAEAFNNENVAYQRLEDRLVYHGTYGTRGDGFNRAHMVLRV